MIWLDENGNGGGNTYGSGRGDGYRDFGNGSDSGDGDGYNGYGHDDGSGRPAPSLTSEAP